ncbi:MAG: hypothetical protein ACYC8V_09485 [Caulobacteraceae bacterium]
MSWLLSLLGFLLKLWKGSPDPKVGEGEKLGTSDQALAEEQAANVEVENASDARDAVARSDGLSDGLARAEAADPDNRDNAPP